MSCWCGCFPRRVMASCERCWERSHVIARETGIEQTEEYRRLVLVNDCTPEQQAGPEASECPKCQTRTVHQHTHQCTACGWESRS